MSGDYSTEETYAQKSDKETLKIDFLYLDNDTCGPCTGTDQTLLGAIEILTKPLESLGVGISVNNIHVTSPEIAKTERFLSSPTIRINGRDIDPARTEDDCPTCGDLAGGDIPVNCRTWHWRENVYQAAPTGLIVEAIIKNTLLTIAPSGNRCNEPHEDNNYTLPANLALFFAAQDANGKSGCAPSCCDDTASQKTCC